MNTHILYINKDSLYKQSKISNSQTEDQNDSQSRYQWFRPYRPAGLKAIRDYLPDTLEVVAFNDIGDLKTMAHLLKYDSNYGRFDGTVEVGEDALVIDGKTVKVFKETDPANIPWGDMGVEIVVESTGIFTVKSDGVNKKGKTVKGAENHITKGGAKKVIISAPAEGEDLTIVLGVNDDKYDPANHHVVSNASCTTNGLAPAVKVVHDKYEYRARFHDHHPRLHQRPEDPGPAPQRPAPGACCCDEHHPHHHRRRQGDQAGHPRPGWQVGWLRSARPTSTVSVIDLTAELENSITTEELRQAFRDAAAGPLKGILGAVDEPLVSIDYKGDPHSSSVDLPFTMVLGKEKSTLVKIVAWYDNEWGYSVRTADLAAMMASKM